MTGSQVRSFDEEFDHLHSLAYRVAYPVLGERGDSQDVAQEALARAFVRWRKVESYAEPWVSRVALNLALDRVRRRRPVPHAAEPVDGDPMLADRLDLQQALRGLPKRQRESVVLRYLVDQSEADVAEALGISIGSVKTHSSRGLAALRAALGDARVGSLQC